jgi:hypothetical protein
MQRTAAALAVKEEAGLGLKVLTTIDDSTSTTTVWPQDPGAVIDTTPEGGMVVVTLTTPLTGHKPNTDPAPPTASTGPQSHPLTEEGDQEEVEGTSNNSSNNLENNDDHVATSATDPASPPVTDDQTVTEDDNMDTTTPATATAGATTTNPSGFTAATMPLGRPASPFLEASRRHQEDAIPATPLQTTTLEEESLNETPAGNAAHHNQEGTTDTTPSTADETNAEEEPASDADPAADATPAADAVETEAPAASWGSGTMPSTQPSSGEQQQQEEEETEPDMSNDFSTCPGDNNTDTCAGDDNSNTCPSDDNSNTCAGDDNTNTCAGDDNTNTCAGDDNTNTCARDDNTNTCAGEEEQATTKEEEETHDCVSDAAAEVAPTPMDTATSATPTSSGRSSCSSSSDDVEVRADNVPEKPASTFVGKYIIPARRYWLNMGDYWWFSQGRRGNTAAAIVLARLKAGEPIKDSRLAALAASHTLEELEEMAAMRYYTPACPLGTTTAPEEAQQVGGREGAGWGGRGGM